MSKKKQLHSNYKIRRFQLIIISIFITIIGLIAIAYATNDIKTIILNIEYKNGTKWDTNNDGSEPLTGIIDFTVENSRFNWNPDSKKLCTKWEVYSIDEEIITVICNGNIDCCNFIGLDASNDKWDEPFYLSYGRYGATYNNIVSSRIIYVDYNLSLENPYSDIYYSDWLGLPANFFKENDNRIAGFSAFSTQIIINNFTVIISSPDNSTIITSGEVAYLNFSVNENVSANYSLDSTSIINLGSGTIFTSQLTGNLPFSILDNGQRTITINFANSAGNNATIIHSFTINDTTPPIISLSGIANNSAFSNTSTNIPVKIISGEYANISYKLNSDPYTAFAALDSFKSSNLNLTVSAGVNLLYINATDMHSNYGITYYTFNFSLKGNCSDGIQNNDETGIDCGGSCTTQCITFNITPDKSIYTETETVKLTVIARTNSFVNITVSLGDNITYRHKFTPVFSGAPIAEQRIIENTSTPGNYTINATLYYLNVTENKIAYFLVNSTIPINPLSVSINANVTTINQGESILFSASVSGNTSAVSYKWDFQNDGSTDSTDVTPSYTYNINGTYTVNLTINNQKWNKTDLKIITVRKLYNATFFVKENITGNPIKDAIIDFNKITKNTSDYGSVLYTLPSGKYDISIKKLGYLSYSKELEITNFTIIEIFLYESDYNSPVISIISPLPNELITNSSVNFRFMVNDNSGSVCTLILESEASLPISKFTKTIKSGIEEHIQLSGLPNGTLKWRLECTDSEGNFNSTDIYLATIDTSLQENILSVDLGGQDENTATISSQIDSVLSSMEYWSNNEKEAASTLQLKASLEKAKLDLQRANRDIHSLKWRRLNNTELVKETDNILNRVISIKDTTPKKLEVLSDTEFIGYPNKEDVDGITQTFFEVNNLKLTKKQKEAFISKNMAIQSMITVTTKAKIIEIEYLSGRKGTITLLDKQITASENLSNMTLYEVIPKDIAKDINETELLFEYNIIKNDPIIELNPAKINRFSYYIKKKTDLKDAEKIKSLLLTKRFTSKSKNPIIGFAIIDREFIEGGDKRLIIEIIIIIILAIIYIVYSGIDIVKLSFSFNSKFSKQIKDIDEKIIKITNYLSNNDYDKAKIFYQELTAGFKGLQKEIKPEIYKKILNLTYRMDVVYINRILDEILSHIGNNKITEAENLYSQVRQYYKNIAPEYKAKVHQRCSDIHRMLNKPN